VGVFEDGGDRYCVDKVLAVTHIQTGVIAAPMAGQPEEALHQEHPTCRGYPQNGILAPTR
jgi:hypothetical protein